MRDRFRLSPGGRHPNEPWFHIGSLGVTTTWLVLFVGGVGLIVAAVAGRAWTYLTLGLSPDSLYAGKVWTLVTWPFEPVSPMPGNDVFWAVLSLVFFWFFARDVEGEIGRKRFAWLLLAWTLALSVLLLAFSALISTEALYGLNLVQLMVVLLWTAEWPDRMFWGNIPSWVLGLVIALISVIGYLVDRRLTLLLVFIVGVVVCAFITRQFGMLERYEWIPRLVGPRAPRQPRMTSLRKQRKQQRTSQADGSNVVPGPWASTPQPAQSRDEQRMDELLDKIHASGTESLTDAERAELLELRERRRKRS